MERPPTTPRNKIYQIGVAELELISQHNWTTTIVFYCFDWETPGDK